MSEELKDIAKKIRATGKPRQITVRKLLALIGQKRRGKYVASQLSTMLLVNGLDCNPGFEDTHYDAPVTLSPRKGPCVAEFDLDETEESDDGLGSREFDIETGRDTKKPADRVTTNIANPKMESSALMSLWRAKQRKPSLGPTEVFASSGSKFSINVDKATSAWVIDMEFPVGGPKPEFIKSLKYVSVLPEKRTATNRRLLSIRYDPIGNDCVDFWPHFAEVILTEAAGTQPKTNCAQSVARTLLRWKKRWPSVDDVSGAVILGLFGELIFLRALAKAISPAVAIRHWQGVSSRDHDFSINGTAFEVKASKGNAKKVTISNLHQLDDTGVAALYLVHIRLRPSDDKTHSLQYLGDEIKSALASDPALVTIFTNKLGQAGWFKAPKEQRERVGFRTIGRSIYHVTEKFPRILKNALKEKFGPAVDLKTYTVRMALCPDPLKEAEEDDLWARLRTPRLKAAIGTVERSIKGPRRLDQT